MSTNAKTNCNSLVKIQLYKSFIISIAGSSSITMVPVGDVRTATNEVLGILQDFIEKHNAREHEVIKYYIHDLTNCLELEDLLYKASI